MQNLNEIFNIKHKIYKLCPHTVPARRVCSSLPYRANSNLRVNISLKIITKLPFSNKASLMVYFL